MLRLIPATRLRRMNVISTLLVSSALAVLGFAGCADGDSGAGDREQTDDRATADEGDGAQDDDDDEKVVDSGKPMVGRDAGGKLDAGAAKPLDAGLGTRDTGTASSGDAARDEPEPDTQVPPASRFPSVKDSLAAGPYKATTISNAGPNKNYTIYQPSELGPEGLKHPVLTWGNGGSTMPSWYPMLPHLATHGFVVVAANTVPSIGAEAPLGKDMKDGLDWILAENARSGSEYFGKLDEKRLAPFGYSMGGLATFTITNDPRWITTVHISGGNMGNNAGIVGMMHAPAMFLCGENDIAGPFCDDDFAALTTQSVFYGKMMGEDHLGILAGEWADRIRGTVTAWMRWKLMDDKAFEPRFVGADCELCKDTNYTVNKKNFE